jgi:hypothetical protein
MWWTIWKCPFPKMCNFRTGFHCQVWASWKPRNKIRKLFQWMQEYKSIQVTNRRNEHSARHRTWESASNVTFESCVHTLKQNLGIVLIDEGMQIDSSDEQR